MKSNNYQGLSLILARRFDNSYGAKLYEAFLSKAHASTKDDQKSPWRRSLL